MHRQDHRSTSFDSSHRGFEYSFPQTDIIEAASGRAALIIEDVPAEPEWRDFAEEAVFREIDCGRNVVALQIAEENLTLALRHHPDNAEEIGTAYQVLAECYEALGAYDCASQSWSAALRAHAELGYTDTFFEAEAYAHMAWAYANLKDLAGVERVLSFSRKLYGELGLDNSRVAAAWIGALLDVGQALDDVGQSVQAAKVLQEALGIARGKFSPASPLQQRILVSLGGAYLSEGEWSKAEDAYDSLLANAVSFESPPGEFHFYAHAGLAQVELGREPANNERAIRLARYALQTHDRGDRTQVITAANLHFLLARTLSHSPEPENFSNAHMHFESALKTLRRSSEDVNEMRLVVLDHFADYLRESKSYEREGEVRDELLATAVKTYGAGSAQVLAIKRGRLEYYRELGNHQKALQEAEAVATLVHKIHGGFSAENLDALREWAAVATYANDEGMAESLLWTAWRIAKKLPDSAAVRLEMLEDWAEQASYFDKPGLAERLRRIILRRTAAMCGEHDTATAEAKLSLSRILAENEKGEEAIALARDAVRYFRRLEGGKGPNLAASYATLGFVYWQTKDFESAEKMYGRALRLYRDCLSKHDTEYVMMYQERALTLAEAAQFYSSTERAADALKFVEKSLALTRQARLYHHQGTLDLLQAAYDLASMLEMTREAGIFKQRWNQLSKRLGPA